MVEYVPDRVLDLLRSKFVSLPELSTQFSTIELHPDVLAIRLEGAAGKVAGGVSVFALASLLHVEFPPALVA